MIKSFKQYLAESKKIYEFKIKLAGDFSTETADLIKKALVKYNVESCSEPIRTPIQETITDFPDHKNINVTIFDVSVSYPVTNMQLQELLAEKLSLPLACIKVRNLIEQQEEILNNQFSEKSGESLLLKDYEKNKDGQKLVGEKHKIQLLKDLNKTKHNGTQYKGVNDKLLAKSCPSEKTEKQNTNDINTKSMLGNK